MATFEAIFAQFLTELTYSLVKGIVSGDISRPPETATVAEADPVVQQQAEDAIAKFDASGR